MAFARSETLLGRILSLRGLAQLTLIAFMVNSASNLEIDPIATIENLAPFFTIPVPGSEPEAVTKSGNDGEIESPEIAAPIIAPENNLFAVPAGFESRVAFWIDIYSKYTADDAVFHDSQNLGIVYKVVDLRPIMNSDAHPIVKEIRAKRLIEKERAKILAELRTLKKNLGKAKLDEKNSALHSLLGKPEKKTTINEAIENLRMQLGQKTFVEKALVSSDRYLTTMEQVFEKKGLPKELTRIPFVESSFNLDARSRVGASGIWQIMPATGRKLMPNDLVDYRNDPIKATDFAASLLKFNYKVIDAWPLAITAYNHGPTSIAKLIKRHNTKDLPTLIKKVYGSHAFGFASSNFYACFLAILQIERNRKEFFPEIPRGPTMEFTTIQLKKSLKYSQLLAWFEKDSEKAEQFNPHLANSIKRGANRIPAGTYLYVPAQFPEVASKEFAPLARKI
jgi:membrane-bound lytic murein transglycosylase D